MAAITAGMHLIFLVPNALITSFAYRLPRIEIELPVEFTFGTESLTGHTRNISDTGLLVHFARPLAPETAGTFRLRLGSCFFELQGRITHTECFDAGVRFEFSSDQERVFMRTMIKVLSKLPQPM